MTTAIFENSQKKNLDKQARNSIQCKILDKHICQLTNRQKAKVLYELYEMVKTFQALEPKKVPRYKDEDLPLYLKRKAPKFKFNHELVPLISSCQTIEVRFTTNPKCEENQNEDPNVRFARIESPGNPLKSEDFSDRMCSEMCKKSKELEMTKGPTAQNRKVQNLPCPVHDVVSGFGVPYQCTHDVKCPGIVVCKDPQSGRSFLCTVQVQRPQPMDCAQEDRRQIQGPRPEDCAQKDADKVEQKPQPKDFEKIDARKPKKKPQPDSRAKKGASKPLQKPRPRPKAKDGTQKGTYQPTVTSKMINLWTTNACSSLSTSLMSPHYIRLHTLIINTEDK